MLEDPFVLRFTLLLSLMGMLLIWATRARLRTSRRNAAVLNIPRSGEKPSALNPSPGNAESSTPDPMTLLWREAFGTDHFTYTIVDEHQTVLVKVREAVPEAISSRKYFPRRPQIIPKLMTALRDDDTTLKQLIDIITQDPVLTGDVLRLANSSVYRTSKAPVENIARAVVLLGTDGLRSVIADSVLQPVFKTPAGYYDPFAPLIWELASRSALAAQIWCRSSRLANPFNAHIATLVHHISYIVLFKLTTELYQRAAGSLPRPEVFTRIFCEQIDRVALLIARHWELPATLIEALSEFVKAEPDLQSNPLARACYVGRHAGLLGLLARRQLMDESACSEALMNIGIEPELASSLVQLTTNVSEKEADD